MIKIYSNSPPLVYQIDNSYSLPSTTGQVRWNGMNKCFEVCDNGMNGSWIKIDNTVQLSSDSQTTQILEWAKKKMAEEEKLDKLMSQYPSLKAAKEQFDIVLGLVNKDVT